jgi:hypothetical protein
MAELTLRFRVINAGIGMRELPIEHDGEPAIVKQRKLYVDAEPLDGSEKTLELVLPADTDIAEGAILTLAIAVENPATDEVAAATEEA